VEYVYLGRDNTVDLVLKKKHPVDDATWVAVELTAATKITATFGADLVESTDKAAGPITWDQVGYDTGEIRLALGAEALTPGAYEVPIIVYDAVFTAGVQWKKVDITVVADEEGA
jgi:hypothetical protein